MDGNVAHCLDHIRHGALDGVVVHQSAEDQQDDGSRRSSEQDAWRLALPGECPTETLDDTRHRVQPVKPTPFSGHQRTRIGHRRGKHPKLHQERHDVADIPVQRIQGGKPQAHAESRQNGKKQKCGQPDHGSR